MFEEQFEYQATIRRRYAQRLNVLIFNDWTQKKRSDVPNVTFLDVLQAMLREKFKWKFQQQRDERVSTMYKMIAMKESPKLSKRDK